MDFITDLSASNSFDSIFVVVDRLTKMAHFVPCKKTLSSEDTARLFLDNVYRYDGLPDDIVSDRGTQFISKFWRSMFQILKVDIKLSSAFHPQTNGQTERVNQVLEQYLRATSTINKMIGLSIYRLPSLRTTIPFMLRLRKCHSSPTMDIIRSSIY
jgi:transposase InsO family protein